MHCQKSPRDAPLFAVCGEKQRNRPRGAQKEGSRLLRRGRDKYPAMGNQRDLNDVDRWEIYLLLLVTHPRYHPKRFPVPI